MDDFLDLLLAGGASAIVALAIASVLARFWLKLQVDKALSAHNASLTQRVEVLKTELSIYAHEHNVGVTRIDAQRSEAILSLWKLITNWKETLATLVAPIPSKSTDPRTSIEFYKHHAQQFMKLVDNLSIAVRDREIFFGESSYRVIARYGMKLVELTTEFYSATFEKVDTELIDNPHAFIQRVHSEREKLREAARGNAAELRRALSREFRVLMGAIRPPPESGPPVRGVNDGSA